MTGKKKINIEKRICASFEKCEARAWRSWDHRAIDAWARHVTVCIPCFHNTSLCQDKACWRDTGKFYAHCLRRADVLFGESISSPEHVSAFSRIRYRQQYHRTYRRCCRHVISRVTDRNTWRSHTLRYRSLYHNILLRSY